MAEPQPPNVSEGADAPESLPANAEDRKAAQALSSLDAKGEDETSTKKEVDLKALNDAMKNLGGGVGGAEKKETSKKAEEAPKKPLIKVDAGDVNLLAKELDMNKTKATELLRAHDADPIKAMTAWVTASV